MTGKSQDSNATQGAGGASSLKCSDRDGVRLMLVRSGGAGLACLLFPVAVGLTIQLFGAANLSFCLASGMALGLAIRMGRCVLPGIFLGLTVLFVFVAPDGTALTGLARAVTVTVGVGLAAHALAVARWDGVFSAPPEVLRFALWTALAGGLGALGFLPSAGSADLLTTLGQGILFNLGGLFAVTPVVLAWTGPPSTSPRRDREGEVLVIGLIHVVLLTWAFSASAMLSHWSYLPAVMVFAILIWSGVRLSTRVSTMGIFATGLGAALGTGLFLGPFAAMGDFATLGTGAYIIVAALISLSGTGLGAELETLRRRVMNRPKGEDEDMQRLRNLLDAAPVAAALITPSGVIRYANTRYNTLLGTADKDMTGADVTRFYADPVDRSIMLSLLERDGHVDSYEFRLRRADGKVIWVDTSWTVTKVGPHRALLSWSTDATGRKQIEETLRSNERRLRAILDDSPVAVTISRPGGRVIYANPKAAAIVGLPRALMIGADGREFYADVEQQKRLADVMRSGGAVINEEVEIKAADGVRRTALFTLLPMEFDGAPARLAWSFDITARKRAEEAVMASEARLRAMMEASPLAVAVVSPPPQSQILYANPLLVDMLSLGDTGEDWTTLDLKTLFVEGGLGRRLFGLRDNEDDTKRYRSVEAEMYRADGTVFWALLSLEPGAFEGEPATFLWAADITERKRAEVAMARSRDELAQAVQERTKELEVVNRHLAHELEQRRRIEANIRRSQTYLRAVLDTVADGIITIDSRGVVEDFNPAAERIFGYRRVDVVGKNISMLMPEPDHSAHDRYLSGYLDTGREAVIGKGREVVGRRKDGSTFPLHLAVSRAEVEGRLLFTGVVRDITEQKDAEATILKAKEEAELANRAKSEFLANMSHELRTPLNAIIGFSEMMQSEVMGPLDNTFYRDYVGSIHDSGRHLLDVINDILDIARVEAGQMTLHEEDVDVAEVLDTSAKLIAPRARTAGLEVVVQQQKPLPQIHGDARRIKQMVLNLLSNAVKFTHEGGTVTLDARMGGEGLEISVTDTGIGMSPEDAKAVLKPFVQVDTGLGRKFEGTGLGLPLVVAMVEIHGGRLALDSTPGVGTTVTLFFPPERLKQQETEA